MNLRLPYLALALLLSPGGVAGQGAAPEAVTGMLVRVHAESAFSDPVVGRVAAWDAAGLTVELHGGSVMLWVPAPHIRRVELSYGKDRLPRGLFGAGVGLIAGPVLGAAIGAALDPTGWAMLGGVAIGVFVGPAVGAAIGAYTTPEPWVERRVDTVPAAAAEPAAPILSFAAGSPLRIRSPGTGREKGTFYRSDEDSLVVRGGDRTIGYAWTDVSSLEARGGRDRWRGAMIGALVLGGVAALFGGIDAAQGEMEGGELVAGIVGNAAFGAGIGAILAPKGWAEVPLPRR